MIYSDGSGAAATQDYDKLLNWSLVLEAVRIPHRISDDDGAWVILVPSTLRERARGEIEAFEAENADWPPIQKEEKYGGSKGRPPTVLMFFVLAAFYGITGPWSTHSAWFASGAVSRVRILEHGEWWRVVTALTLHADPVHLLGNAIIGGMVVHFLCRTLGSGWGWLLLMLAGAIGNVVNVAMKSGEHLSVGFSTAVFGAVGILSGLRVKLAINFNFKSLLLPLGAGAGLLALLGTEGENTDLGAHLWGFLVGVAIGSISALGLFHRLWERDRPLLLLAIVYAVVFACWRLALQAG